MLLFSLLSLSFCAHCNPNNPDAPRADLQPAVTYVPDQARVPVGPPIVPESYDSDVLSILPFSPSLHRILVALQERIADLEKRLHASTRPESDRAKAEASTPERHSSAATSVSSARDDVDTTASSSDDDESSVSMTEQVAAAIINSGKTTDELAQLIGIHKSRVSEMKKPKKYPKSDTTPCVVEAKKYFGL